MKLFPILIFCLILTGCRGFQSKQTNNNTPTVELYNKHSDDINAIVAKVDNNYELTRLGYACYEGNLDEVKRLIHGGMCMTDDIYEFDVVYAAAYFEKRDILEYLISDGRDINVLYDENGMTALSMVCQKNNIELAALLLTAGADADGATYPGSGYTVTPLLAAVGNNNVELVKLLLQYNADVDIAGTDYEGNSPLDIAINNNNDQMIKLLMSAKEKSELQKSSL